MKIDFAWIPRYPGQTDEEYARGRDAALDVLRRAQAEAPPEPSTRPAMFETVKIGGIRIPPAVKIEV